MSKQNAKNKGRKEPKLAKNVAKSSLEIGEELNIDDDMVKRKRTPKVKGAF